MFRGKWCSELRLQPSGERLKKKAGKKAEEGVKKGPAKDAGPEPPG
jgi:hypothetical protein